MRRTGSPRLLALAAVLVAAAAHAEVEFYQTVDRNKVGTEDTFRLTIVVGGAPDGATVQFPAPNDFEVLQRSQSTQMSYSLGAGNAGVIKREQKYTLILRANRAGKLTIPPAALSTAQKTYKTEAIAMEVVKGRTQPDPAQQPRQQSPFPDPFAGLFGDDDPFGGFPHPPEPEVPRGNSDTFLRASIDKDSVYVGEQLNYSLYIYSRADLASVDSVMMPKLEGFLSEDLDSPTSLAPETRSLGGVPYRAYLLRRRALFPLKPGKIEIDPASVDITTGWFGQGMRLKRKGNTLDVEVKALPKDAGTLNVGQWRLSREASQTTVAVGAPLQVRVTLVGRGNLKSAMMPKLAGPGALRIYEPTTSDKPLVNHGLYGGTRVQEYVVLPQQTGTFVLPAMALRYFNPETGKVEESTTDPITLTVTPGAAGNNNAPLPGVGLADTGPKNRLEAGGLKALRHTARFEPASQPLWRRAWFVPFAAGPFALTLAFGLFGLARRATSGTDPASEKRKKARAARARLAAADKLRKAGKTADFYAEIEKALYSFLEARLGEPAGGLTRDLLEGKMALAGVSELVRGKVKSALDTCDMGRFAPGMGEDAARGRALDEAATAMEAWDTK